MFRVIKNLFSSNPANVLIDEFLSPEFEINCGVLQGSKLGPILFNIFINDLLEELGNSNLGATIGDIRISVLGFADDIVLVSDSAENLQALLDICHNWTLKNNMTFKTSKCKVMILNGPYNGTSFLLNNDLLEIVEQYEYLGVLLSSKYITNLFKIHFSSILERAKVRVALISKYGFDQDGLRLDSAIRLYKLQVRPILEYCAQSITFFRYAQPIRPQTIPAFARDLEHFQTQTLKKLTNCPRSTSPAIVRLFCGVEPLFCRLEFLKARYFWKVLHGSPRSITHQILTYRRKNFLEFNKGFAHEVFNICCKYDDINLWHGISAPKTNPLIGIRKLIITSNLRKDLEIGRSRKSSFATVFLSNIFLYQKTYHIVEPLKQINFFASSSARKRFFKAILHPCNYSDECFRCRQKTNDMLDHLLTRCIHTLEMRNTLKLELTLYNYPNTHISRKKHQLLEKVLTKRTWLKCFTKFLIDVDF